MFYRRKVDSASHYNAIGSFSYSVCLIGLQPGEYYIFRVLAYTEYGNGVASDPVIMSTQEKCKYLVWIFYLGLKILIQ